MSFPVRVSFKIPLAEHDGLSLSSFIPIFHRWIVGDILDDTLIDVTDYSHVPDGPGIVLIGHRGHYRVDGARGALGLEYDHKRCALGTVEVEHVSRALKRAVDACLLLGAETGGDREFRFETNMLAFRSNDRLRAPISLQSRRHYGDVLHTVMSLALGGSDVEIQETDSDQLLEYVIRYPRALDLTVITRNLSGPLLANC